MEIARLREGIKWICSQCNKLIPTEEGISIPVGAVKEVIMPDIQFHIKEVRQKIEKLELEKQRVCTALERERKLLDGLLGEESGRRAIKRRR